LSLIGVAPGTGQRMGIDRDADGVLDTDEPLPLLQITSSGAGAQTALAWPYNAAGFQLEETPELASGMWTTSTNAVTIANGFNYVTNDAGPGARFFRLRQP